MNPFSPLPLFFKRNTESCTSSPPPSLRSRPSPFPPSSLFFILLSWTFFYSTHFLRHTSYDTPPVSHTHSQQRTPTMSTETKKVTLYLDCIAADPTSTTLYGITSGTHYGNKDDYVFLIKSIPNPDHIDLDTWTMVSESTSTPFSYNIPAFKTVDCTVSSKGVFTAFFRNADYLTPRSVTVPVGIRYDTETQKWTGIRTSPNYGWRKDMWTHMSFYVNNSGVETLVHMFSDKWGSVIRFGVFNEAESVLQLASVWKQVRCTRNAAREVKSQFSFFIQTFLTNIFFSYVRLTRNNQGSTPPSTSSTKCPMTRFTWWMHIQDLERSESIAKQTKRRWSTQAVISTWCTTTT